LAVMLHVGVPPPPPLFPQIFDAEKRCNRAAPPLPLPITLHGTAGAQFTSVTAAITKSRVGRKLFLLIMTLHAPFFYLFGSERPPYPRTAGSKQDIKIALFCLESMS